MTSVNLPEVNATVVVNYSGDEMAVDVIVHNIDSRGYTPGLFRDMEQMVRDLFMTHLGSECPEDACNIIADGDDIICFLDFPRRLPVEGMARFGKRVAKDIRETFKLVGRPQDCLVSKRVRAQK